MATKKKTKKATIAKPFELGEVIKFPCGATVTIHSWGSGGVIVDLSLSSNGNLVQFCISDEALKMIPALSKRALANVKLAEPEDK